MSSNIKIIRVCEFCKNEFTARTTKTLYCSLKCSSRAYKARTRQSKIDQSDRQTEIAKNPDLEIVKTKDFISVKQVEKTVKLTTLFQYKVTTAFGSN